MAGIRIVIAVHQTLVREACRAILSDDPRFDVVGVAADGAEALRVARESRPDLVLVDRQISGINAVALTRMLREELPDVGVVIVSSTEDPRVLELLRAGARGYVPYTAPAAAFLASLRRVAEGGVGIPSEFLPELVRAISTRYGEEPFHPAYGRRALTPRELEVLKLVSRGLSNREIAVQLRASPHTIRAHLRSLTQKLGAENRTQLAVMGVALTLREPTSEEQAS